MNSFNDVATICGGLLFLTACPPVQRYRPAPLSPTAMASALAARSLADPGLKPFIEKNIGNQLEAWPPKTWDLQLLTLAAFYFNPTLQAARARLAEAEGAVVTAGARPNPTLTGAPGIPSPYLLGLDLEFPIETAGKRRYRVEGAKSLNEASRYDLADIAWKVRSGVRTALVDYFAAVGNLNLINSQETLRLSQFDRLNQRLRAGEIARPELESAGIELLDTRVALRTAEGRLSETKTSLAASIGIPVSALDGIEFAWPSLAAPPSVESLSPVAIQRDAVLNRLDVRRALAEYAATEAALQLEIAKQHPDLQIGPGYQLEETHSFFTVGFLITLPVFNRNQGPIAEAQARRKEAGVHFLATQAQVIRESELALAHYRSAVAQLAEAQTSLAQLQKVVEPMARHTVAVGEADSLSLNGVLLQGSLAEGARLNALYQAQAALGRLEDAVERPLEPDDIAPLTPQSSILTNPPRRQSNE
jgi:cobalt-zinc-cadmium efflux system outer membrane protein